MRVEPLVVWCRWSLSLLVPVLLSPGPTLAGERAADGSRPTATALPGGGTRFVLAEPLVFPVLATTTPDGRLVATCDPGLPGPGGPALATLAVEGPEAVRLLPATVPGGVTFQLRLLYGFADPTPVEPIGGNTGTTLGEQRRIALEHAAAIWSGTLRGTVPITVDVGFRSVFSFLGYCQAGAASFRNYFSGFRNAPRRHTLYVESLANTLAWTDLSTEVDFSVAVNEDFRFCGDGFYYGIDGNAPPSQLDFVSLLLHEFGHGLGFASPGDVYQKGAELFGLDDAYTLNLEEHATGKTFPQMSSSERLASSHGEGDLHWVGAEVLSRSGILSEGVGPGGHVEMQPVVDWSPSIDHFRTSLFPDELMEPGIVGVIQDPGLAVDLLVDVGWTRTGPLTSLIPGDSATVRSGRRIKGVHRGRFVLPVALGGASLHAADTGGGGGSATFDLPAASWTALGDPPGSRGYRFKDDTCTVVLRQDTVQYRCKDTDALALPLAGDLAVTLVVGEQTYCARFGGSVTTNTSSRFKARSATAPPTCAAM